MMRPRKVDFLTNGDDFDVVLLGMIGWSTQAIAAKTGLSWNQVTYRLGRAGITRADYRNGESAAAKSMYQAVTKQHIYRDMATKTLRANGALRANAKPQDVGVLV